MLANNDFHSNGKDLADMQSFPIKDICFGTNTSNYSSNCCKYQYVGDMQLVVIIATISIILVCLKHKKFNINIYIVDSSPTSCPLYSISTLISSFLDISLFYFILFFFLFLNLKLFLIIMGYMY